MNRGFREFTDERPSRAGHRSSRRSSWTWPAAALIITLWLSGCGGNPAPGSKTDSSSQKAHGEHAGAATPASSVSPATPASSVAPAQSRSPGEQTAGAAPTPRIPAYFASGNAARPFPPVLDPRQFSDPVVAKAYRYAAESPEVFSQQPCYCYCDSGENHRSLLDCFATRHGAT
jgi:hypothetical protein